jgi:endonuclease/exonuclease/phosphatase family metal-dependent hydrolase
MVRGPGTITVGTLNIGGLRWPRAPLQKLPERAGELCRRLDDTSIDVLNLQEVFDWPYLTVMREHLRTYPYVALRRRPYGPAGGLATFSRLPLGRPSYRSFIGANAAAGGLRFRLRHVLGSAMHGVLMVDLAELPVTIANTHLSANHDGDWSVDNRHYVVQRRQLARLNRALDRSRRTGLSVVTGDYNIASDSIHYPLIVRGRRDPFAVTDPTTFHGIFLPPQAPPHRIDYALVTGDERRYPVLAATTLFAEPVTVDGTKLYLSDHIGLTIRIGLAEA